MSETRCGICCSLCKLFCCPPIPSRIVSKVSFLPPKPSYLFATEREEHSMVLLDEFGEDSRHSRFSPPGKLSLFPAIHTRRGNRVAAFHITVSDPLFTILYCHGNAVDLGQIAIFLASLGQQLQCDIFALDYSGYGISTGAPREANLYADIDAAFGTLRTELGVPADRIVLYGQSIGTVPTVDLASRQKVAGVILHSPLASGLRLMFPSVSRTWCCDPFPSIDKAPRIDCPTLVIHGDDDDIIPVSHGHALATACAGPVETLFIPAAGHNDIEMYPQYFEKLVDFVTSLRISQQPRA
eukprot:m.49244 g.49244  ORF g.49244 m.49244 type:complete len:297 (-) comp12804_c0_seq1:360-1250(-)